MKSITKYICKTAAIFSAAMLLAACENTGDDIYLSGHQESGLTVSESDVVLSQEQANQIVLSMMWTKSSLTVSESGMYAPDVEAVYIQISTNENFTANVSENKETNLSRAYTGAELNTVAKNIGAEPEKRTPLYFRIRSSIGLNTESKYSNTATVYITPYQIDMSIGYLLEADNSESVYTLLSPASNGVYTGFIGAVSWYNFWLREGDGVVWGNYPENDNTFKLGSSEDATPPWNCWFPGQGGCYYVVFDTQIREWTALYIPQLNVSGDMQMEMSFDRRQMQWKAIFNASGAGSKNIRLSGTGKQYNFVTGTDDNAAVDTPVAFGGSAEDLSFDHSAGNVNINIPGAGEYTLVVDLSNPQAWNVRVQSGSEEPVSVYPQLFLPGIDDAFSGAWTFDNPISLYDEENLNYAGVVNVNSLCGYKLCIEQDNWSDFYVTAEGDAYSGSLVYQGEGNIPAPEAGLYIIEAGLAGLTYNLTAIGDEIWVMGMDENYEFNTPLTTTGEPGVFSGEITIVSDSPWGLEIQINNSWAHKFGGSDNTLYYKGSSINDAIVHTPGTYTMTVDLVKMTYSIL